MIGAVLRSGPWRAIVGLSAVAAVVGGAAAAVPKVSALLLPVCYALLGAAAALALDEPAALVVDVTPTSAARRAALRSLALPLPLAVGVVTGLAVVSETDLPRSATGLALIGTVMLGFSLACVARTRTGEPGAIASVAVGALVMTPALVPRLPSWLRTFPSAESPTQPSNTLWSIALVVCACLIAGSLTDRSVRRGRPGR